MKTPSKAKAAKTSAKPAKAPRGFPTYALETVLIQTVNGPVCGSTGAWPEQFDALDDLLAETGAAV